MFVGEIGIGRSEFLYEIQAWEARRIIKGYRKRNVLQYQLQRIQAWASMFCMGNPKGKGPNDIFHLYFDDDEDEEERPTVSDDEIKQMQREMAMLNRRNRRRRKSKP